MKVHKSFNKNLKLRDRSEIEGGKKMDFHNYPLGKKNIPFNPSDGDNYFAYCNIFSYLGNYEEIGNISSPMDERNSFFLGGWVLNIFKRYEIIEDGKVIFTNDNFNDGHIIGASRLKSVQYAILTSQQQEYEIPSWGANTLKTYSLQDDSNHLQLKLFENADDAVEYAIQLSKEQHMKCIVA